MLGGWVYYRVGSNESGWSDTFRFDTRPFVPDATTSVSVFGDLGFENSTYRRQTGITAEVGSDTSRRQLRLTTHWSATWTRDSIVSLKNRGAIDAVIHLGDIGCECSHCSPNTFLLVLIALTLPPSLRFI